MNPLNKLREGSQALARRALWRARVRRDPRRIAVAIPTHNRAERLLKLLPSLLRDTRISEIVIRDDASDAADYTRLTTGVTSLGPRVRLARNERNLGAFANKVAVMADCQAEWAILLDSDNRLDSDYVDRLYVLPVWSKRIIYCPQQARPRFDFRFLTGATLDEQAAGTLMTPAWQDRMCVFLNTGNYLAPTREYVARMTPYLDRTVGGGDVFFANLIWLHGGGLLHVLRDLEYDHDVHDGSWFRETASYSKPLVRQMRDALIRGDVGQITLLLNQLGRSQELA